MDPYRFPDDGQHVRLRSRVHGTYLHADEDGRGVSLSRLRACMNAAWAVHRYHEDSNHVLLQSAAYGRYLVGSDASAPLGCRGFRVAQRKYELDEEAFRCQAFRTGRRDEILLLHHVVDGDVHGYLRANGRHLPWNDNVVSVEAYRNVSSMMVWVVERIPSRQRMPRLPRPTWLHLPVALLPSRVVMFQGHGEGCYANNVSFSFRGRSVFRLRNELIRLLCIGPDVSDNLVMYAREGRFGRFTPLVVDLPRSRQPLFITAETLANGGSPDCCLTVHLFRSADDSDVAT